MKKKLRLALVAAVAALALAQAVPVERTNPPVESEVQAPPAVKAALRKSCWDCHSNETVWGWHTKIAPISWLVAHDVNEGREHLNFSRWNAVDGERRLKLARKLPEEVGEGEMPMPIYLLAHPDAKPTDAERAAIVAWGRTLGSVAAGSGDAPAAQQASGREAGHDDRGRDREHGERERRR
jgi:hypothetical protein